MAVQMRNAIGNSLRQSLPVSLAFNYPTVNDIVDYLEAQLDEFFASFEPSTAGVHNRDQGQERDRSPIRGAQALLVEIDQLLTGES